MVATFGIADHVMHTGPKTLNTSNYKTNSYEMMNVSLTAHSSASCLPHRSPSYAAICCHCRCRTFQKLHLHASNRLQEVISLLPTPCCAVLGASLWGVVRSEPRHQTYSTFSHSLFHASQLTDRNFFEHHKCSCVRVCKELVAQGVRRRSLKKTR